MEWVQNTLLQESMSQVVAALVLSEDEETKIFVNKVLLCSENFEERVKDLLKKCPCIIQIPVKWKYFRLYRILSSDTSLIEQLRKWLTFAETKCVAGECIRTDVKFMRYVIRTAELCSFFASVLSTDELFVSVVQKCPAVDIKDSWRCWGENVHSKPLLKFRFQRVEYITGKSIFQSWYIPDDFMEKVWEEIEDNIQDAVDVVHDDEDFLFIQKLEKSLMRLKGKSLNNLISLNDDRDN